MSLAGSLFICTLIFAFVWTWTKQPILGLGAAAIFWSLVHFFVAHHEAIVEERHVAKYGSPIEDKPSNNIFVHHGGDDSDE